MQMVERARSLPILFCLVLCSCEKVVEPNFEQFYGTYAAETCPEITVSDTQISFDDHDIEVEFVSIKRKIFADSDVRIVVEGDCELSKRKGSLELRFYNRSGRRFFDIYDENFDTYVRYRRR